MSNAFGDKILLIRKAEGLSRAEFAELTGISPNTIQNFEIKGRDITSANLARIVNHARFIKYTMWLMTGEVIIEAGQIAPAE